MADDEDYSDNETWEAYRQSAAFRRASFHPPDEIWTIFSEAEECCDIIDYFKALVKALNIDPNLHGIKFYEILKSKLTSWKCQSLWDLLNARLKHKEYKNGTIGKDLKCIIVGAGPIGLRTGIELLLLGCKVSIVEKRTEFTRNNVLHLWPFLLTDFRGLGAKKFYGKFGAGCIDHINIRTLQCILLKVVLILGGELHVGVSFKHVIEPKDDTCGWTAAFEPENLTLSKSSFDVVIGADGKKNVLPGFPQIELRGALAIGITCNFVNNNTIEEARVPEISGVSYQFNPNFFNNMQAQYGVKLENIVYYKNETHYFVMTALKSSLLQLGVIKKDVSDPRELLSKSNVDKEKLVEFTWSAVNYATDHQLPPLEFKKLSNGDSDIALFDFTSIKKAANASRIIERKKQKLLMALVGDSLIEPFWPTGSGCGRGVLSALDVAWMVRQFAQKHPPLSILRERENIFKLLGSSSNDSLQKNYKAFTIDPRTRYSGFDTKRISNMTSLKGLYDTDDLESADMTLSSPTSSPMPTVKKTATRKRSTSGGAPRKVSTHLHPGGNMPKTKRKSDRAALKDQAVVGSTKKFWEEHNKKNFQERANEHIPKNKFSQTSVGDLDFSIEELSELEDDVIEPEPKTKKGFNTSERISLKRQASRDEMKTPRGKSNSSISDDNAGFSKKKFQAKGGGLKARRESSKSKYPEQQEQQKSRKRLSSKKRHGSHKKTPDKHDKKEVKENIPKAEPPRKETPANFFRKWMATLSNALSPSVEQSTPNEAVDYCTRHAAATLLAIPILLDCNRPTRRTTGIKIQELNKAKEFYLNPSNDNRQESKEISVKRAGSVKHTVAKYKMMTEQEEKKDDYYEFLRRTSRRNNNEKDQKDGVNVEEEVVDFSPKEVIDVEKALLDNEREERSRSAFFKTPIFHGGSNTIELKMSLEEFADKQTPLNSIYMLQVLYNIHKRINDDPSVDKYYRIYTKGHIFERYVWLLDGAESFMIFAGWVRCGNYLVLSKSYPAQQTLSVIEEVLRRRKRAQVMYTGSMQRHQKRPDVSIRRAHSNIGRPTTVEEDEVLSSYTTIETIDVPKMEHQKNNETDSAFGSGDDEEVDVEKRRLRRVKSQEHTVNSENYIVVDFVGNLDITSRKSTKTEYEDDFSPESALSVSLAASINSTFEELSTHDLPYVQSQVASVDEPSVLELEQDKNKTVTSTMQIEIANKSDIKNEIEETSDSSYSAKTEENMKNMETHISQNKASHETESSNDVSENLSGGEYLPTDKEKGGVDSVKRKESGKKTYVAPKGLKQAMKEKKEKEQQKLEKQKLKKSTSAENDKPKKVSIVENERPKRLSVTENASFSNRNIFETSSLRSSRKTGDTTLTKSSRSASLRSFNNETGITSSIVLQNKLLFDNKISDELKYKYPSAQNLDSRKRSSQIEPPNFNRNDSQSSSFNEKTNIKRTNSGELDLTGIVAGAKGVFEIADKRKRRPVTSDQKTSTSSNDQRETEKELKNENIELKKKNSLGENISEHKDTKKKKNIFKRKKEKDADHKQDENSITKTKEEDLIPPSDVHLVNVVPKIDASAEEISHGADEFEEEKKKKGIFSRMKKRTKNYNIESKHDTLSREAQDEREILEPVEEKEKIPSIEETIEADETIAIPEQVPNQSTLTAGLQDIINRQTSFNEHDKVKKKNVFKKKKRKLDEEKQKKDDTSNGNITAISVDESEQQNTDSINKVEPQSNIQTVESDHTISSEVVEKQSGGIADTQPEINDNSVDDTTREDISEHTSDDNIDSDKSFTTPSISVEEIDRQPSVETASGDLKEENDADSGDDLVSFLDEMNSTIENDRLSSVGDDLIDAGDKVALKKKKKKFPFSIKSKKDKKKAGSNDNLAAGFDQSEASSPQTSPRFSKKSKHSKISDKQNQRSQSLSTLEKDNEEHSKKKTKISLFKKKKKTDFPVDNSRTKLTGFTSYTDVSNDMNGRDYSSPLETSDEFKIPELPSEGVTRSLSDSSGVRRTSSLLSDGDKKSIEKNEYSKKDKLIEIQRSEELEF